MSSITGRCSGLGQDLDQAHAAVGRRREARVPAVVRDLDPLPPGGADDGVARLEGDRFPSSLKVGIGSVIGDVRESFACSVVALAADHVQRAERRHDVAQHAALDELCRGRR